MSHFVEIDEDNPQKIVLKNWDKRFKQVYDSIPTSKYVRRGDYWQFNLTWQTCLALKETFRSNLVIGENLRNWTTTLYTEVISPAYELRDKLDADGYPDLFPHQRADVQFLKTTKRALLANDMGVGKTRASFSGMMKAYEEGNDIFPMFIACPNSTKFGWKREIEEVWPGLKVTVVDGTAPKRRKQLEEKAHVYIMNWESIRSHSRLKPYGSNSSRKCTECGGADPKVTTASCEVHIKELNNIEFKAVIGDEIHRIMDPHSKVSRAFKAATGNAEYRFGLSGTPIGSNIENLFSILNWLYPEAYPSKKSYIARYCETAPSAYGPDMVIGIHPDRRNEFFGGLDPFLRRVTKEAVLKFLPPVIHERRDVEMGAKQKKAYDTMKKKMVSELDGGDTVSTTSPLVKMGRLHQFASAYGEVEYSEVVDPVTLDVHEKADLKLTEPSCKLDAFMTDLDDFGDESIIVFAHSKQLVDLLAARFDKLHLRYGLITGDQDAEERQMYMDAFQNGQIKYIICTIAAGGTGITLTKGSIMVFLQRSWSMIDNNQAEARGHRIGSEQHDVVRVIDYVTKNTVEEDVIEAISEKTDRLQEILRDKDLMRKCIEGELINDKSTV